MNKTKLLKVVVVIGLSLLLVANLASIVFADDATYGWDDPTATSTQANTTSNTTSNTATSNTYSNTASTTNSLTTNITTETTGSTSNTNTSNTSISTGNATTTLNTSTNETSNEVNSLAYTGVESNSVLVVIILIGAIVAGYSLKKVKEYNNI